MMDTLPDNGLFFDRRYSCLPCSSANFSLFSTSKSAIRPLLSLVGGINLFIDDMICIGSGEEAIFDFGIRLLSHGCPLLCTYQILPETCPLVCLTGSFTVTDYVDLCVVLSNPGSGLIIVGQSQAVCSLSIRSGCECVSSSLDSVTPLIPLHDTVSTVSGSGPVISFSAGVERRPDCGTTYRVMVCAFTVYENSPNLPVEKILRWIYSDNPRFEKLSPYAATTGLKSTALSGVQEFYRHLHPVANRIVNIFTDDSGLHYLFSSFRNVPGGIPFKYRAVFQRARFARSLSLMPAHLHHIDPSDPFIVEAYQHLLTHLKNLYAEQPFYMVAPFPNGFEVLLLEELPGILGG